MTRKKDTALAQPVNADKWERQRQAERIKAHMRVIWKEEMCK
jgi:hypothetical protein